MPNTSPEISVTGTGVLTCLGASRAATVAALARGRRVQGRPSPALAATPYADYLAAQADEADLSGHIRDRRMKKFMSRHAELAAVAARQALLEAAPIERGIPSERIGLYAGVGLAAANLDSGADMLRRSLGPDGAFDAKTFAHEGLRAVHPLWSFHALANMPACIISVLESIKGDNGIYTPWEDQTAFALVEAIHALGRGEIDCAVILASDTPEHPASLAELAASGFLAPDEVAASGAACLVLEGPSSSAKPLYRLAEVRLDLEAPRPPADPLAPFIGRTVAAAPLLLAALAPHCPVPRRLTGCGGHVFSFEVA